MKDNLGNKILIREFSEDGDTEVVLKLEKKCEIGSSKDGISMFTNMMGDPLCRIRFYPVHVMLVAELLERRKLVGIVRGCIKYVGTGSVGRHVKLGCILGLRVSPSHRRMGIGLKLVQSIEEWMVRNGAEYSWSATEEKNVASTNLFSLKCNYVKFSSLLIYVQPISITTAKAQPQSTTTTAMKKLSIDEAISFYKTLVRCKDMYPGDMDEILKERPSLGTWVFYPEEDQDPYCVDMIINNSSRGPSSWVIASIWNACEAQNLDEVMRKYSSSTHRFNFLHATLRHAREMMLSCLGVGCGSGGGDETVVVVDDDDHDEKHEKGFGFVLLYGLHGEGERVGELMKSVWSLASWLAENVKECKAVVAELSESDPLRNHVVVPHGITSSMSCLDDVWYIKRLSHHPCGGGDDDNDDYLMAVSPVGNVFVDPRDF